MNILFLSNYYPPAVRGGYEQLCQEVAEALVCRGHRVGVLTTTALNQPAVSTQRGVTVHRKLHLEVTGGLADTIVTLLSRRRAREAASLDALRRSVDELRPDVAMIWGMWNVPRTVPALAEHLLNGQLAYYLCDYWPSLPSAYDQQLTNPAARRLTRLPKLLVGRLALAITGPGHLPPLRLENVACVSSAVRDLLAQAGLPMQRARVIPNGIQVDDFQPLRLNQPLRQRDSLRLLYAGRLVPEKGVHTAIRALGLLQPRERCAVTLQVVGQGDTRYTSSLHDLVRRYHLEGLVDFCPSVPRAEMPRRLAEHDALIFPSEWEEPSSRIVLEAMAVGLGVIGTPTGGTGDVLVEGKTGLTYPPGDAPALAAQIERLRDNPALGRRLAEAARQVVEERFSFTRMVDDLVTLLANLAET